MNAIIKHAGMPFPKGEIVPAAAFDNFDRLVELGALEPTEMKATIEPPIADVATLDDDELASENERLKKALEKYPGQMAEARQLIKDQAAEIERLKAEVETAKKDAVASAQLAEELQKQVDNLASNLNKQQG